MSHLLAQFLSVGFWTTLAWVVSITCVLCLSLLLYAFGSLWLPAYFTGARVSLVSLIRMRLLGLNSRSVVRAMIMGQLGGP